MGWMKANQPPRANKERLERYSQKDIRRVFRQAWRSAMSTGHGACRARHCASPPTLNISPAKPNTISLYSLTQTIPGKTETSVDSAAPAPNDTSSAGSAQQISVPELANRLRMLPARGDRLITGSPSVISLLRLRRGFRPLILTGSRH